MEEPTSFHFAKHVAHTNSTNFDHHPKHYHQLPLEAPTWSVLALTWLCSIAIFHYLTTTLLSHRRQQKNSPPGPKPWPIIGNFNLIGSIPHQSFHLLSQKYGEIMQLKFGSFPVLVVSSPEMAKEVLKVHDETFASRPPYAVGKYTGYNYSDMSWAPYGAHWRQARRIYVNELFSPRRIDSYEYIRMEERRALMSRLHALSGKKVVIKEELTRFTLTNITRMVYGSKYFSESESDRSSSRVKLEELKEMVDEWFFLRGMFNVGDWIPWLGFLDLQGYVRRMKALFKKFDRFNDIVIADHKAKREAEKEMLESDRSSSRVKLEELKEMVDEWFFLRGMFNVGDWIPWLGFLDLQGYVMRMKALFKKFDRFNDLVIADHKAKKEAKKDSFVAKDMVDVLLQLADDPNLEVKLSSDRVKGLLQDPISGGTDTSAITVEWAVSELLKQPQLLEKATEELDRVIGKHRWVEEDDLPNLPYLDAIVKETLRLHPVATLLAPHSSTEDCKVAGYDIPKGTTLLVNVWSIGRDPRYWEEHKKFLPERFIGKNIDVKGQHFELLPFGSGRRMCPAYRLGLKLIKSTLANLLHGFELKLPDNVKPEDVEMEEEYGLTTHRKIPIVAVVGPRLPTHLYALE